MSLPVGFGTGTDFCPTCNGRVVWDQVVKEFVCKSGCKRNKEMTYPDGKYGPNEIPITKHQLGLYVWYGIVGLALLITGFVFIADIGLGIIILIFIVVMGNIFGYMAGVLLLGWTVKETLPWLQPFLNAKMESKWHFKKELDYGNSK